MFMKKNNKKYVTNTFNTIIRNNILLNSQLVRQYNDGTTISVYAYSIFQPNDLENTPLLNHFGQHIYNTKMDIPELRIKL